MFKKITIAVAVLLLTEAAARFYRASASPATAGPATEFVWMNDTFNVGEENQARTLIHPYFGFVQTPRYSTVNTQGFHSDFDFPYVRKPGDFVVGIFGASVAENWAQEVIKHGWLKDRLPKVIPALKGKNIVVLNMASGGYKQPQQYQVHAFYAEMFDLTINVDGLVEVTTAEGNGVMPVGYPMFAKFYFTEDGRSQLVARASLQLAAFSSTLRNFSEKSKSAAVALIAERLAKGTYAAAEKIFSRWKPAPLPRIERVTELEFIESQINLWRNFIVKQQSLAKAWKTKAYFFIQPNRFFPGAKAFTDEELRFQNSPVGPPDLPEQVARYYPRLIAEARKVESDAKIFSLTGIFKNESKTTFTPDCCHMNTHGYELMNDEIVRTIARHW